MNLVWQNKFLLVLAGLCTALCIAFLLAFVALPKFAYSGWSGSNEAHHSWSTNSKSQKSFGEPIIAQSVGTPSNGYNFPKLTGRVVDDANLLNSTAESKLVAKLAAFETKSSDQVVVVTINSLNDANLEEYSNLLFREWELGQADENNGVLLLISKNDRKIRIEVGYGLEGILTDAISKIIIDQTIVPHFKAGNFGVGIVNGADQIISVLSGDKFELEARSKRNFVQEKKDAEEFFSIIFMLIWGVCFFGSIGFGILAPIFGEKIGKGHYKWLGMNYRRGSGGTGGSSGGYGGGYSGGGGGFSGGGGSSGGGGASGGW